MSFYVDAIYERDQNDKVQEVAWIEPKPEKLLLPFIIFE